MTDKDKLKAEALKKLDWLVKAELKRLEDTKQGLGAFKLEIPEDYFNEEERKEVANSITQTKENIKFYCLCRGIESPLLN